VPLDNVQRFEWLIEDANTLQSFVDQGDQLEDVNGLTVNFRANIADLIGEPVSITGGEIETVALEGDLTSTVPFFAINDSAVEGIYKGMMWRMSDVELLTHGTVEVPKICHIVQVQEDQYLDDEGNEITKNYRKHVTVQGSKPVLLADRDSHDYRVLAEDGFSLKLDKIALDETKSLQEKADVVAKMFYIADVECVSEDQLEIRKQRLSYLNVLGIFANAKVTSKFWISRNEGVISVLRGDDEESFINAQHMSTDQLVIHDGAAFDEKKSVLSFDFYNPEVGTLSIPYSAGQTKVS